MVAAVVLIAVTALLVWQWWPLGDGHTFMLAEWQLWPQGGGLFALGVWAGEAGSLDDLTRWAHRLGWIALAAAALWAAMAVYLNTRGQLESAFHGTSWLVMLNVVLYSIISVAVTVWFTALIRARWSGDGPLRARAGRASYATYVLHPLVLTAIMVLFASLALAPELKFLVVAVVAVPVQARMPSPQVHGPPAHQKGGAMAITTAPHRSGRAVHHGQPIMIAVLIAVLAVVGPRSSLR